MSAVEVTRSQAEIVTRYEAYERGTDDFFGFRRDVLLQALDFDHARPFLKDGITAEQWADALSDKIHAASYLKFAIGKALDHRGLSAERSVMKLAELAWLAGRDDVVSAMADAPHAQYGVPALRVFGEALAPDVWADLVTIELQRMADGDPCRPGCEIGCGE